MKTIDLSISTQAEVVKATIEVLKNGGLVIFPTETVYGAGVDATNQDAVNKLLAYKSRREGKPLSIAVPDQKTAAQYVDINKQATKLYKRFLPGPVTVVSKSKGVVAEGVASEFGTLGVRIPDHQLLLDILKAYDKPITATSANGSGEKRPYTIQDIFDGLSEKQKGLIDLVLDAGRLPPNEPSTVIDTTLSTPTTLRAGTLSLHADLQQLVPHISTFISASEAETKQLAGTLLLKHWDAIKENGLVIGLEGPLGAGKTIFAKGVAEFLKIEETITSPTYSYIEEYVYNRHNVEGKLFHLDVWKVDDQETASRLEINQLLQPKNVVVVEWWSQIKDHLLELVENKQIPFIAVSLEEKGSETREISVNES
jgi:L-threonylcarbamoyladenylate synthase